jgi:hypothetical protein
MPAMTPALFRIEEGSTAIRGRSSPKLKDAGYDRSVGACFERAPATCWRATASSARRSPAPEPALSSSNRRAASTPHCNAAPTFSYADYERNLDGAPSKSCEPSLCVWARVMSRPTDDRAIVDAGLKAPPSTLARRPSATNLPPPTSAPPTSTAASASRAPPTGRDRRQNPPRPRPLRPTVNLYDWYVGVRGNRVEQLWPITARGAVY